MPKGHQFLLSVVNAEIPYSFYLINNNNNRYKINGIPYSIPEGNYNILELLEQLKFNHPTLTFTYRETTNKVTISSATPFSMENESTAEPFLRMIGFKENNYSGLSTYTSDSVVDLSGYNNVFIFSNIGATNVDSFSSTGSHVLCKIPLTASSNGVIFYNNTFGTRHIINMANISEIKIQILSNLYFPINLNYVDFTIALQLDIIKTQGEEQDVIVGQAKPIPITRNKKSKSIV